MQETTKSEIRRLSDPTFLRVFSGIGIDIGAGDDVLNKSGNFRNIISCESFDIKDGDAQYISKQPESYDFVYSSHCLEHMVNPYVAISNWFRLVKPGGHLIVVVPDEDLYEQGVFPSRYNHDHKWTFTIDKSTSWHNRSINLTDIIKQLSPRKVIRFQIVDTNFDHSSLGWDQTIYSAEANIEAIIQKPL